MKQPAVGLAATALVIIVSLAFVSLFDFPTFAGWVSYYFLCVVPIQIVMAVTWGTKHPALGGRAGQPARGLALTAFALFVGAIVAAVSFATVGGGVSPPTPMLAMCMIVSVPITFWAAIMWGGWPFSTAIKNPLAAGLAMLLVCYIVNYVLFRALFDYGFMRDAPVYVPRLDPHGLFPAWNALVFYITALAAMFLMLNFDLWPLTAFPGVMRQPTLGIVWTLLALGIGALAFVIGIRVLGMDVVAFLVRVPVPFIFGTIIVLNMLQGSLFAKMSQPAKGVLNVVTVVAIGTALALIYGALAPRVTGALKAGPPSYDFEIWLASALLSVTFPFLIFYAEFFKMWPLSRS